MEIEFIHTGGVPVGKIERGKISKSHNKNLVQSLIIQDSQDPDEDMEEIDIEVILLEAELRKYRKRENSDERANLSSSHEPIFKSHRW